MIDTFANIEGKPSVIRVDATNYNESIKLPSFLKVLRDISDDSRYKARNMAVQGYEMPKEDINKINEILSSSDES